MERGAWAGRPQPHCHTCTVTGQELLPAPGGPRETLHKGATAQEGRWRLFLQPVLKMARWMGAQDKPKLPPAKEGSSSEPSPQPQALHFLGSHSKTHLKRPFLLSTILQAAVHSKPCPLTILTGSHALEFGRGSVFFYPS